MKLVVAYIQPHKRFEVSETLRHVPGMTGMTVTDVQGCGKGHLQAEHEHPNQFLTSFDKHCRFEVLCANDDVARALADAIQKSAHTGLTGDGVIYISTVDHAVRISSGERGNSVVT